jgi:hypothetical protein
MNYIYAIEYFDGDSSGSQWETHVADCISQAVKQFKFYKPHAKVYNVFVQHRDADDFLDEEWQ